MNDTAEFRILSIRIYMANQHTKSLFGRSMMRHLERLYRHDYIVGSYHRLTNA